MANTAPSSDHVPTAPTDVLLAEHRVIERVLACLQVFAARVRAGEAFHRSVAERFVEFLSVFADRIHHAKEEDHLFPSLEECGLPREAGPTTVMRHEHEIGRGHVRAMADALEAAASEDSAAREHFVAHGLALVDLLHEHIAKEDQVLFPMADRLLPPSVQEQLLVRFTGAVERVSADHRHCLDLADRLCEQFGVTEVVREFTGFRGCGASRVTVDAAPPPSESGADEICCGGHA